MSKIREIIVEPSKIICGSTFRLKIKAIRYLSYQEMKELTVNQLRQYTVAEMKGDEINEAGTI